jgi:hypothetical protein
MTKLSHQIYKPSFIHIGPQRCATTLLYRLLRKNRSVPVDVKEIQFFDRHYEQGIMWYLNHFKRLNNSIPIGEVCPTYFFFKPAINRIYENLPGIKVICTLRDPVSRTISYYRLLKMYNQCQEDIELAWTTNSNLRNCCMYSETLKFWITGFSDQFLTLFFDDLLNEPSEYFRSFFSFVGIPFSDDIVQNMPGPEKEPIPKYPIINEYTARAGYALRKRKLYRVLKAFRTLIRPLIFCLGKSQIDIVMTDIFKEKVRDYYKPEIENLESLTDRNLSDWLE